MRVLHEKKRGCGYRKPGAYLTGEPKTLGTLPLCVPIDPPIPLDTEVIPFSRGIYTIFLDAVLTEEDQRLWLADSSRESLKKRDLLRWEIDRCGMGLDARRRAGICAGMSAEEVELRLATLTLARGVFLADYILAITKAGKGRRVAREAAVMQQARLDKDYRALLASCWRLAGYSGVGEDVIRDNLKRIMVSVGAMEDAVLF